MGSGQEGSGEEDGGQDRVQCIFGCKEKKIKRQIFEEAEKSSVVVHVSDAASKSSCGQVTSDHVVSVNAYAEE